MLTEGKHAAGFLVSEAPGTLSRDEITVLAGSSADRALTAGMVLGKRVSATAAGAAFAGNTASSGAISAVTVTGQVKPGIYKVLMIEPGSNAGRFSVENPDGVLVGVGTVAVEFVGGGLTFTIADATDFVAGDGFNVTVTFVEEKWLQYDPSGTLGEQVAAGILRADVTAPDAVDAVGVAFTRYCEVNAAEIVWPAGISVANKAIATRALLAQGIKQLAAS